MTTESESSPKKMLDTYGAFVLKDILSKEMREFLTHVMVRKHDIYGKNGDAQIPNALTIIDHELFLETLHEIIWPKLEAIVGEELLPTYTYSRLYSNGDVLEKHKDRDACEVSVTVQLGRSHHYAWPIYVENVPFYLAEGDGVVYKGCDVEHWRDACSGPENYYSGQAFFHFVKKNGKRADQFCDAFIRKVPSNFYLRSRTILMDLK
jgi:hypothetical protein